MNTTASCLEAMQQRLQEKLKPSALRIEDLSHQHRFHQQAPPGQGHYHVVISRDAFDTNSRIQQHRAIYTLLAPWLGQSVHALKITVE